MLACLAALVLLAFGVVEVLPRPAGAPSAAVAAGTPASTSGKPTSSLAARSAGLAGVPAPTGAGDALLPGTALLTGPSVVTGPQSPPRTSRPATPPGSRSSRAPPLTAGT